MPTTIAFVNNKGGVGKTSAATLIAAALQTANQKVSIEDRDPQQSATTACNIFGIPSGRDGDIVIIDTAPNIKMPETMDAIRTADLVVLVTTPSPLDLATTAATAQLIQAERREGDVRLLFNLVQTNNRFFEQMDEIAKEIPFRALGHYLLRRTAYQVAQLQGWKAMPSPAREDVLKVAMEIARALPANV